MNDIYNIEGLSSSQVIKLKEIYGPNEIVKAKKSNPLMKFFDVFKEPMFLLLIGASILYMILGEPKEAMIMMIFVIFVAGIAFIQEWRTEKTLNALKDLSNPKITVIRDGVKSIILSKDLVPGDIIQLSEGERIPADCEILSLSGFSVDESILTGESETVFKSNNSNPNDNSEPWKSNIIYAGTLTVSGQCIARVVKTGLQTEYGKISKAVLEAKEESTPLQKKTRQLVVSFALVGISLCVLVIILTYIYTHKITESILTGITLAMAIIPEEFPVIMTVFLSLGAFRMAKQNALIRKIPAVETLGSVTVLCVDKTGTLTKNSMEVQDQYVKNNHIDMDEFMDAIILACEKHPYDPMEKAIEVHINKSREEIENQRNYSIEKSYSFDPRIRKMANIYRTNDNKLYIAVKGSFETILPLCGLNELELNETYEQIDIMADKGLRVLAIASNYIQDIKEDINDYKLNFLGIIGLADPPREGVKEAISTCIKAGIRVLMITGDYSKTAIAVGKKIGLKLTNNVLSGNDIGKMNDFELSEALEKCDICCRMIPEYKMNIVKILKRNGEIVAMTGDGVNDAPALKYSDIGIAMGKRGTEVAKESSSMILTDDNFTTIVKSVADGRRIFDNIRKAIVYVMIIHIPIAGVALLSPLFNLPQILLPIHIVLLELIIDPTCSIIFEGEKAEPYIMDIPPRSPKEPLIEKKFLTKVVLQGLTMLIAVFVPFHYLLDSNYPQGITRSFALTTIIFANIMLVLVNRSNTEFLTSIFKELKNIPRLLITALSLVILILIVYIPALNSIFKTGSLSFSMFACAAIIGSISTGWWEITKFFQPKHKDKN